MTSTPAHDDPSPTGRGQAAVNQLDEIGPPPTQAGQFDDPLRNKLLRLGYEPADFNPDPAA